MSQPENPAPLSSEERLKAIAYQFIALYERWSEDRQVAAKQGADTAELVHVFTEQVKGFQALEPRVREQLKVSIQQAFQQSIETVQDQIEQAATEQLDTITTRLNRVVQEVSQRLRQPETQSVRRKWLFIGILFLSCMAASLVVGKWAVPQPYLPLSGQDLQTYLNGLTFNTFWPKLSKHAQEQLLKLGNQPENSNTESDEENPAADNP